ncbi:MAG: MFS transporter [Lentisphaerae bacterium]|nr:MFS transporter [Lentisphaerota bacterium]
MTGVFTMNNVDISSALLRKKKMMILICGIVIFFLTSMAKVLIPATIFEDLQKTGMDVNRISTLGALFLYAYAASQLLMGCFSDRYGGVRILLIGGSLFSAGTIIFPLLDNYFLMLPARLITGFGAGTIFLGVAKLLDDLFSKRFGIALGIVLVFGYLGPTTGTMPMVKLVETIGWRPAMILPGIIALIPLTLIFLLKSGTIVPVTRGQTFEPLMVMLKNKNMWYASLACATIYGAYYTLLGQIGQKTLTDLYALPAAQAAMWMMLLTIIVAVNTFLSNMYLSLAGNRRKVMIIFGVLLSLAGILLAQYGFSVQGKAVYFIISAILIAFPAGFFSIFGIIAKELNPPRYVAMSVAYINFMAFLFISSYQNITGWILKAYPVRPGSLAFPIQAYNAVYLFFLAGAVISLIGAVLMPETKNRVQQED